jgi:hypothetical protein
LSNLYKKEPVTTEQINFIGPEQIGDDILGVPEDVEKLREDAVNVLEGRVDISQFDEKYQEKIKNYYRFSANRYGSRYGMVAKRTRNTLDIL